MQRPFWLSRGSGPRPLPCTVVSVHAVVSPRHPPLGGRIRERCVASSGSARNPELLGWGYGLPAMFPAVTVSATITGRFSNWTRSSGARSQSKPSNVRSMSVLTNDRTVPVTVTI